MPLQEAKAIGDEFLQLEKYVNLNYMGFHKVRCYRCRSVGWFELLGRRQMSS